MRPRSPSASSTPEPSARALSAARTGTVPRATHNSREATAAPSAVDGLAVADASDIVDLDELAVLLKRPKSTVSAWRRSMELVLDRTIPAVWPYPAFDDSPEGRDEEKAWRESATLVVPEWGACKLPHQQWTHSRKRVIAFRERGARGRARSARTLSRLAATYWKSKYSRKRGYTRELHWRTPAPSRAGVRASAGSCSARTVWRSSPTAHLAHTVRSLSNWTGLVPSRSMTFWKRYLQVRRHLSPIISRESSPRTLSAELENRASLPRRCRAVQGLSTRLI